MLLSVVTADPHDAGRVIPIGNLSLDTSLEFPAFALAPGEATADLVFVNRELDQAIVRDLLADSSGLLVRVAAVTLRDASGRPFAFDRTAIDARTASIVIDYAGRESTESYRVATSVDRETLRLPLRAALTDILRIPFETNASGGLTTVRGVAEDASIEAHWVGLLVTTDGRVERYVPLDEASSIDTLELKSGDTLRLVYLEDADHDGLGAREELIVGTDPTQADTDGDGLEDGAEVRPGFTHRVTTPDGTSDVLTFTDPRRADTDGDSLSDQAETSRSPAIDPTRADTDGDTVRDPDDYAPDVFQTLAATLTPRTGTTATTASVDYALPAVGGPIQYAIVRAFQGATSFDLAALPDDGATLSMSATLRCTDDTDCFTVVATGSAGGLSPTTGTVADTFPSKSGGTTIRYVALLRVGNQWLRVGSARTTVPSPAPDHRLQVRVTGGTLTCWDGNFDTSCELYWRFLVDGAVIAGGVPETSPVAVTSPSLGGMPFGPGFLVPPSAYSPTFTAAEITGRCFTLTIELYDADDGNTATTAGDPRASHDRVYCWDPARSSYYGTELADDERWDFALSTSDGHGTDLGTRGTLSWDLRTEP
ncbi:MAG: hypothetical protein K1X94_33765 [Sandaracinaceae bacterium]|nr:hypothetical protein [Sandaracinaceae bacterium]